MVTFGDLVPHVREAPTPCIRKRPIARRRCACPHVGFMDDQQDQRSGDLSTFGKSGARSLAALGDNGGAPDTPARVPWLSPGAEVPRPTARVRADSRRARELLKATILRRTEMTRRKPRGTASFANPEIWSAILLNRVRADPPLARRVGPGARGRRRWLLTTMLFRQAFDCTVREYMETMIAALGRRAAHLCAPDPPTGSDAKPRCSALAGDGVAHSWGAVGVRGTGVLKSSRESRALEADGLVQALVRRRRRSPGPLTTRFLVRRTHSRGLAAAFGAVDRPLHLDVAEDARGKGEERPETNTYSQQIGPSLSKRSWAAEQGAEEEAEHAWPSRCTGTRKRTSTPGRAQTIATSSEHGNPPPGASTSV